jgi:hypothetical protein
LQSKCGIHACSAETHPNTQGKMMLRRSLLLLAACVLQGCATPPSETFTGPTATIADTATGGGRNGGTFYYLAELNGKPITENTVSASRKASFNRGFDMRIQQFERPVPAGRVQLKLSGEVVYAAPIQNMLKSSNSPEAHGVVEVDLKPHTRYRITGTLDAFRREIWIEEENSKQILGHKIINTTPTVPTAAPASGTTFTCCNLRYDDDWISDANWSTLPFIPAGTPVVVKDFGRHRANVTIEGRPLRIGHDYGRQQQTKEEFVAKLVVAADPNLRIATFPRDVQAAIRAGKVMPGMTKEQVIISLGYPRTDTTPSTDLVEWVYRTYEDEEYVVIWGTDQRVKTIDGTLKVKRLVIHPE